MTAHRAGRGQVGSNSSPALGFTVATDRRRIALATAGSPSGGATARVIRVETGGALGVRRCSRHDHVARRGAARRDEALGSPICGPGRYGQGGGTGLEALLAAGCARRRAARARAEAARGRERWSHGSRSRRRPTRATAPNGVGEVSAAAGCSLFCYCYDEGGASAGGCVRRLRKCDPCVLERAFDSA